MKIQDPSLGDEEVFWKPSNKAQVAEAKSKFDAAIKKGMRAFTIVHKREAGEPITEFDPALGEIILVAALVGG